MISLSELLFGPLKMPSPLPGAATDGDALPQSPFARTLSDARAALGLPVPGEGAGSASRVAQALPGLAPASMQAQELPATDGAQSPEMPGLAALSSTAEDPHPLPGQAPVVAHPALLEGAPATLPGLPQPAARPVTPAELDLAEPLPTAAPEAPAGPAALPAMLSADARGTWSLGLAVRATTMEGTGQGSPSGNGLPHPGADGGKGLPDLPPARVQPTPAAAADGMVASARTAAAMDAAAASTVAMAEGERPGVARPAAPATPVAAHADQASLRGAPAIAATGGETPSPVAQEAAALARLQQERGAMLEPRLQQGAPAEGRLPAAAELLQRSAGTATAAAPTMAAERPSSAVPQATVSTQTLHATSTAAAGAVQPGTSGIQTSTASITGQAPLPTAMPEAGERPVAAPASEAARQLGAVELRTLDPTAEAATDVRRPAGADLLQGQPGQRQEAAAQLDGGAVAAVIDRRTMAEAAGQRRSAEQQASAAAESVDRSPATGTEAAEQNTRPQTARPVVPTLAARDLSALAERIEMLVHRRSGLANVNLTLSELGDVEISVRMESRQAHVQFLVQDATARETLEAQLPRLRDLLSEGGLELGDFGMNMRERSGGEAGGERDDGRPGTPRAAVADAGSVEEPSPRRRSGGDHHVLDAFA